MYEEKKWEMPPYIVWLIYVKFALLLLLRRREQGEIEMMRNKRLLLVK